MNRARKKNIDQAATVDALRMKLHRPYANEAENTVRRPRPGNQGSTWILRLALCMFDRV